MILLQANQVSRKFAEYTLYENINFSIQTRDRIGLVGRNGTGKSTLIQQIMGEEPLSDGQFTKIKDLKIGYLEQHVAIHSDLTIWEEMLACFKDQLALREKAQRAADQLAEISQVEGTDSSAYHQALAEYDRLHEELNEHNVYQIESDIRTVLHGFSFYPEDYDRPVQSLSGGQKTRLALAQLLLKDYDLLILDEPTNHLDMATLAWLEDYLQSYKGALLIVSHDRYFLDKVVNQVFELRHHQLHIYKGNYSFYTKEKQALLEQEIKAYEKQQDQIAKLEDFIARNIVRKSTTKQAQSRRKQLEKMDRIPSPKQDPKAPRIQFSIANESGEQVIQTQNLSIGYPETDHSLLAKNINLDLKRQDAIAIVGPNGIGKTTLLKTLLGQTPSLAGSVKIGSNVSIGYYAQNVNSLREDLTVLETLWSAHDNVDEWQIRSILGSFLFSGETVEKKVSLLSGGEKARLALALLACDHDNTLLLDEPTNHLDIDSKEVLEDALIEYDGTLLFVSHDRYFINRIASQIIEISPNGATLYLGDYDYYLSKKQEFAERNDQSTSAKQTSSSSTDNSEKNEQTLSYEDLKALKSQYRKLDNQVQELWQTNEVLEEKLEKLHLAMAEAAESNDQDQLLKLDQEVRACQAKSEEIISEWEEKAMELEAFLEANPQIQK